MDSAARKIKRSSRTLDESGYKFGGDTSENLSDQGKGSSPTSLQGIRGKGTQVLSARALRRLETLSEVSKRGQKARNLFRLMGDPTLWMLAYSNIYPNKGAMTPGVDKSTMDGFSEDRALNLIELLKEGMYNHKPVRRTYIPKSNGKVRPLGIPTGDDKLVQEVARIILERIFEPIFSDYSHGFRPKRSCHTALLSIQNKWHGVKWIINVDIKGYFDNIDHEILIKQLENKIDDKRFITLIKLMLKAGYMEDWAYHKTHSGTPQGGIISPLLSNIYLDEMDRFAGDLISRFNVGIRRAENPIYGNLGSKVHYSRKKLTAMQKVGADENEMLVIKQLISSTRAIMHKTNSKDPFDPKFRRLHYCRYADDFTFGVIGSKADAIQIYEKVREFISGQLNLEVSEEKSGVSHFEKGFNYLGYVVRSNTTNKLMKVRINGRVSTKRTISGSVSLLVPTGVGMKFALNHKYINPSNLRATRKPFLQNRSDEEIIYAYNSEFRGLALYYALAKNVKKRLSWLQYIWLGSLLGTLAKKHNTSISKMHKKLSNNGELVYWTAIKGKSQRVVVYKLKHLKSPTRSKDMDQKPNVATFISSRTELIQRLNAGKCEYCGRTDGYFEVHHKNKLKNTHPGMKRVMAAMRRKTIVLCVPCHHMLHAGTLPDMRLLKE